MGKPVSPKIFNIRLVAATMLCCVAVAVQLYIVAAETQNWKGFWFSMLHVGVVGVGSVLALRRVS